MIRTVLLSVLGMCFALLAQAQVYETSGGKVRVSAVIEGLDQPWGFAFLPSGDLLITERDKGELLLISLEAGKTQKIAGVPEVVSSGQGGLLDVALDPDFRANRVIYLSYAQPQGRRARTAVMRAVLDGTRLRDQDVIFAQEPAMSGGRHFGSRIVPDGKGNLWVTLGDRGAAKQAQDLNNTIGKVVRIKSRGGAASGNPFAQTPELWSIGHRNAQGAAMDERGRLWTVSHGAAGGDEINRPQAGRNYGWPVISYGKQYSGGTIGVGTARQGMEQPVYYWDPSIAPSGMAIYSGKLWPEWKGDIFVGSLKFDMISRLDRQGDRISGEERLLQDVFTRIRDVREAPDGTLWFLAIGEGALFRMEPAGG